MASVRKPFQGIWNIIRFNRDFYFLAISVILVLILSIKFLDQKFHTAIYVILIVLSLPIIISLIVSTFVYDLSGLYRFQWMNRFAGNENKIIININAGFDETSSIIKSKFNDLELIVLDFYDPSNHTEPSIRRARKAYPSWPGTLIVKTQSLPMKDKSVQLVFIVLAAHEIRNRRERIQSFSELSRILTDQGKICVTEHLRDFLNCFAYTIGAFHFHSRNTWMNTFRSAGLVVKEEIKSTPFITTFILQKNGITS